MLKSVQYNIKTKHSLTGTLPLLHYPSRFYAQRPCFLVFITQGPSIGPYTGPTWGPCTQFQILVTIYRFSIWTFMKVQNLDLGLKVFILQKDPYRSMVVLCIRSQFFPLNKFSLFCPPSFKFWKILISVISRFCTETITIERVSQIFSTIYWYHI